MITGINFAGDSFAWRGIARFGDGGGESNNNSNQSVADAYSQYANSMMGAGVRNLSGQDRTNPNTGRSVSTVANSSQGAATGTSGQTSGLGVSAGHSPMGRAGSTNSAGSSVNAATRAGYSRAAESMRSAGVRNLSGAPARPVPTGMSRSIARSLTDAGIANLSGRGLGARSLVNFDPMTSTSLTSSGAYDWTQAGTAPGGLAVNSTRAVASPTGFEVEATGRAGRFTKSGPYYDTPRVSKVVEAGRGWTTVELTDGTVERRAGTRATRNNNPGNIEYGDFARRQGAVGTDGRFAVFESPEQGREAMEALVFGPNYRDRTISAAITRYAPPHENNSKNYASTVAGAAGVSTDTRIRDLSEDQKDRLIGAMIEVEGGQPYRTDTIQEGTGVTPVSANSFGGGLDVALVDEGEFLHEIDRPGSGIRQKPIHIVNPNVIANSDETVTETTFDGNYLDPLDDPQTVDERTVAPSQPAPATPEAEPSSTGRGLGSRLAAGAIDVGVGLIPAVGTPATVFNVGAALTGNRTIGERVVDSAGGIDMLDLPPEHFDQHGGFEDRTARSEDGGQPYLLQPEYELPAAVPAASAEDFERKYLVFDDGVDRPTPAEKWDRRRRGEI